MPVSPHPITVTVYDLDGTTVLEGATITARNCTKKTTLGTADEGTTNASGIAAVDIANLPLASGQTYEYETGDVILIIAHNKSRFHAGAYYEVTGSSKSQTLYLKRLPYVTADTQRLLSLLPTNANASTAYYYKLYAFDDAELLAFGYVPGKDSRPVNFGGRGIQGKAILEVENKDVHVTGNYK